MYLRFSIKESKKMSSFRFSLKTFTKNTVNSRISLNTGKSLSIYLKIWINYSQMISIIYNLNLKWPYYVGNYLNVNGNLGSISTQILSLDCLISDYKLNIRAIYLKAVTNITVYVIFVSVAGIFFFFRKFVLRKKNQLYKYIILIIALSIMIQPNSIKETSDIFSCQPILERSYLIQQMSVECYTNSHMDWVVNF